MMNERRKEGLLAIGVDTVLLIGLRFAFDWTFPFWACLLLAFGVGRITHIGQVVASKVSR